MSDPLQIHPEGRALLEEIALLREELAHLFTTEHELLQIVKPNLLALYQQKIGAWEIGALQVEIELRRTRRRLEMAQAAVNRGEAPDWTAIDGQLELEFLAWQQKLKEAAARLTAAEERMKHLLPPEKDRELKKLYYALVKKLHPDVNPELTEDQRRLWLRVRDAYEAGDLDELRALLALAVSSPPPAPTASALDALRATRDALQKQSEAMEQRLAQIESQPPFPLRPQLADEDWVAARRQELEARTAQLSQQRTALDAALQALLKSPDDGQKFGSN
jgi:predicted ATP-dependent endonuclease of OLD family